jgi:hypothetical protein
VDFLFTPYHRNVVWSKQVKEPDCSDMVFLARLIPLVCHSVYQVYCVWGGLVHDQVLHITPTILTSSVLSTLGQVDHVANQMSKARY